ncbi:indoleamine 2,3-dioxygenase alpha type [Trichodelitschia bisporula]|uniref:Indoleamine 2,3-dioxygenase n=1 Tax=Trichodelitschia bisporula TaxID=703511 RepID=A0A6G1HPG3_9PEZI|nr:indoleamine 2,3-dioxygenase alpha type [Trichodelitschia bisporula]
MIPQLPRLGDYDVSPVHGFLPTEAPLECLPGSYYAPWEHVISNLQPLILTHRLRHVIDNMSVLDTSLLCSKAEWRRAYSILGFMVHAYIWGGPTPQDRVPPSLSIPFLEACRYFEIPPVATYAGVCLWNWKPVVEGARIDHLEDIFTLHTFTGSMDESWFYLVSVAIEARSGPLIPLMLDAMRAVRSDDSEFVTECLRTLAECIDKLGTMMLRMNEACNPQVFYHTIRPFLAGSKNMAEAGLPNGVIFDTGSPTDAYVQFSGGSNAQSSIIQFFDLILNVNHRATGEGPPAVGSESYSANPPGNNFLQDMRSYMPGQHRRFLEHIARVTNIHSYVEASRDNCALKLAWDACVAMLHHFRSKHMQIVSRYIVVPARDIQSGSVRGESKSPEPRGRRVMNLATASKAESVKKLRGTGGTALIPFLKQARDETGEKAIGPWARRLMGNGPGTQEVAEARLTKVGEHANGGLEVVGLAGVWRVDDSEGGICHW